MYLENYKIRFLRQNYSTENYLFLFIIVFKIIEYKYLLYSKFLFYLSFDQLCFVCINEYPELTIVNYALVFGEKLNLHVFFTDLLIL